MTTLLENVSRTKLCEFIIHYVALSFGEQHWRFVEDVVPVCLAIGIEPLTAAMLNLRNAHVIERVGPKGEGWHRITHYGKAVQIPLGSKPWWKK